MPTKGKSELQAAITRGRKAAGSLSKLLTALGEPRISIRTVQKWEAGEREPPADRAAAFVERVQQFLASK